jgi:HK97 gp10 family phage protein
MSVMLKSDFPKIARAIPDEVKDALKDEAEKVASIARSKAPLGATGNLRDSIKVIDYNEPGFVGYRVVADARSATGKNNSHYAHFVEHGSVKNEPARPFLVPALEESREPAIKAIAEAIEKAAE